MQSFEHSLQHCAIHYIKIEKKNGTDQTLPRPGAWERRAIVREVSKSLTTMQAFQSSLAEIGKPFQSSVVSALWENGQKKPTSEKC